jgi:sulfate transport system permease protein
MSSGVAREVKHLSQYLLISITLILFIFLILLPLSATFSFAFDDGVDEFISVISTEGAINALTNSIVIATFATFINMGVGTLIAFVIIRYKFPGKNVLKALIDLPIAIPTAVVGLSLMMLYGPLGLLGPLMEDNGIQIMMSMPGVLLAHIFVTFPFMVRSVSVALEKHDINQDEAAQTLGANKAQTFTYVTLPSIRTGLVAGSALTFTRSLGEFGATLFVAGGMVQTAPLYIYYLSDSKFDFQGATSIAIILMIFPFLFLFTLNYIVEKMEA